MITKSGLADGAEGRNAKKVGCVLVLVFFLCAWGLARALAGVPHGPDVIGVTAVCLLGAYLGFRLLRWALTILDRKDLFSPLIAFPLAYILWFTLGTLDFIDDPWHVLYGMFDPMPPILWLYSAIGLAGYLGGVLWIRQTFVWSSRPPDPGTVLNRWRPPLSLAGVGGLAGLMLGTYAVIVRQIGLPVLSLDAAETRLEVGKLGAIQALFLCSAWTVMLFLAAGYAGRRWSAKSTGAGVAASSLLLLSLGGRGNFFIGFLTLMIAWHYLGRRIRIRVLALSAGALFVAMSAYGFFRDLAFRGELGYLDAFGIPSAVQPLVYAFTYIRGSIATFRDVTALIPSEIPYQHGRLTLLPFSTLLPGHHDMADVFFKSILGHDFVGLGQPATPLGPLYGDFGLPGIWGGMFVFGLLAGVLYGRMRRRPTVARVLVYAWVLQTGLFGLFGSLFPYITNLFVPLLWLGLDRLFTHAPPPMRDTASPAGA